MEKKIYLCSGCLSGDDKTVGFISDIVVGPGDVVSVEMENHRVWLAVVISVVETHEGDEIHQWLNSFSCLSGRNVRKVYKAAP